MNKKTAEALEASIRHWEQNAEADNFQDVKVGSYYCPLCSLFNKIGEEENLQCKGCPVFAATGVKFCEGTPFNRAREAYLLDVISTFKNEAQAEVEFLKSLREEGTE